MSARSMSYETILVETKGRVGIIRLNRPQALNALNSALNAELAQAVAAFDADDGIGCILITGSEKAFAAGADIKEMADKSAVDAFMGDFAAAWHATASARKPVIAAVAGFALGGGCELVMQCDIVIAADTAKFGQPEIKLGIIPGIGGTQRLPRAVGKAKAMDLILTGRMMDAAEAERAGLVSRVVPAASLMDEAMKLAETIAAMSLPALIAAKEAVNRAFETPLAEGIRFERRRVSRAVRHRGPEGRHGGVRREAAGEVQAQVAKRVPGAAQHVVMRCRPGIPVSGMKATGVPDQRRTVPLRFTLRRVRDTRPMLSPHANHPHHRRLRRIDAGCCRSPA